MVDIKLSIFKSRLCWSWWFMPVIPALEQLRQEDCKFKANLGCRAKPYLNNSNKKADH
jgi:hypothetical protein